MDRDPSRKSVPPTHETYYVERPQLPVDLRREGQVRLLQNGASLLGFGKCRTLPIREDSAFPKKNRPLPEKDTLRLSSRNRFVRSGVV